MPASALEVTIWTDAQRVALCRQTLDLIGSAVTPIGVGGPRVAEVARLASDLDTVHEDDLRKLLVERPSTYVLLATNQGLGIDDLRTAVAGGSTVLTIEPAAGDLDALAALRKLTSASDAGGRIVRVPDLRQSPGWQSAADPGQTLGPVGAISYLSLGRVEQCSLYARLYEAWQVVLGFANTPGSVPATITASLSGSPGDVPEELEAATGHLCAHAVLADDAGAVVQVSDRAGQTTRELSVVGQSGHLRISDAAYALFDSAGRLIDQHGADATPATYADLVAGHWRRLIDRAGSAGGTAVTGDDKAVIACCLACLLSARTHQPESPRRLLQMHEHG